jgi:hypothetical protein
MTAPPVAVPTRSSTLGVLARQEIRGYLRHKLFWVSAAGMVVLDVAMATNHLDDNSSTGGYMIVPAALLGLFGLVTMFGLTRRSDRAALAAGAVAVPERTRTLALATATVVPFSLAFVSWLVAVTAYFAYPPDPSTVPPAVSDAFVAAQMFGDGVLCAVGGPLLGLLLARYLPRRGVPVVAVVVLAVVTILLQGNFEGGQPYRVWWVWTYFVGQVSGGWVTDGGPVHWATAPGNPFLWLGYLVVICALGVVVAVYHDPESDRPRLRRVVAALLAVAVALGIGTMTVGYPDVVRNPIACTSC